MCLCVFILHDNKEKMKLKKWSLPGFEPIIYAFGVKLTNHTTTVENTNFIELSTDFTAIAPRRLFP